MSSVFPFTDGTVMMSKEGSTKIVISWPPGQEFLCKSVAKKSYCENAFFLEQLFSLHSDIDQAKWGYSNNDQGRVFLNLKFHAPCAQGLVLGRGHIMNMQYFFSSSCLH